MLSTVETAFPPAPAPVAAQSPDRAEAPGLLLVGLSGGPDSLALSAAAALILDPATLLWSFLGAATYSLFLAINHRRDRYIV